MSWDKVKQVIQETDPKRLERELLKGLDDKTNLSKEEIELLNKNQKYEKPFSQIVSSFNPRG